MKQLELYKSGSGKEPFAEWLAGLDKFTRAKIMSFIKRVALGGSKKNLKAVGLGVIEIKISFGPGYRVYYGENSKGSMLLLLGGDKNSQTKDIQLAQFYWRNVYVPR